MTPQDQLTAQNLRDAQKCAPFEPLPFDQQMAIAKLMKPYPMPRGQKTAGADKRLGKPARERRALV